MLMKASVSWGFKLAFVPNVFGVLRQILGQIIDINYFT